MKGREGWEEAGVGDKSEKGLGFSVERNLNSVNAGIPQRYSGFGLDHHNKASIIIKQVFFFFFLVEVLAFDL